MYYLVKYSNCYAIDKIKNECEWLDFCIFARICYKIDATSEDELFQFRAAQTTNSLLYKEEKQWTD